MMDSVLMRQVDRGLILMDGALIHVCSAINNNVYVSGDTTSGTEKECCNGPYSGLRVGSVTYTPR